MPTDAAPNLSARGPTACGRSDLRICKLRLRFCETGTRQRQPAMGFDQGEVDGRSRPMARDQEPGHSCRIRYCRAWRVMACAVSSWAFFRDGDGDQGEYWGVASGWSSIAPNPGEKLNCGVLHHSSNESRPKSALCVLYFDMQKIAGEPEWLTVISNCP
jgi:hypothetical protein